MLEIGYRIMLGRVMLVRNIRDVINLGDQRAYWGIEYTLRRYALPLKFLNLHTLFASAVLWSGKSLSRV